MVWNLDHKILIQGIDQPKALTYLQEYSLNSSNITSNIMAGVPDEYIGEAIDNIPIFDLVTEAISAYPQINTTLIFSHPYNVLDAGYEAIDAGIKQIIINTKKIPPFDLLKLFNQAKKKNIKILGPSQGGLLIPEKQSCGIQNGDIYKKGNIGIINYGESRISQELALFLQDNNLGESIIVNIGNDKFTHIDWHLWLTKLAKDILTKVILVSISDFANINKDEFISAIDLVKNKLVIIYDLDANNLKSLINNGQAKIITDQIPQHLNRVFSLPLITEYLSEKGIKIINNYQEIPVLINS